MHIPCMDIVGVFHNNKLVLRLQSTASKPVECVQVPIVYISNNR